MVTGNEALGPVSDADTGEREHIAERLLSMRRRAKLSERELGKRLGYSHVMIWGWETGTAPVPLPVLSQWIEVCEAEARIWADWRARLGV